MIWESELEQNVIDLIRFKDYLKNWNESLLPETYKNLMIMDILHLSKSDIDSMEYLEKKEALHYSIITYKMRCMATMEKSRTGKKGDTFSFDQPDDFDIDPNFISNVGK